jgi:hypothetical protein
VETERVIRDLLEENGSVSGEMTYASTTPDFASIKTPETYFGYQRMDGFVNAKEQKNDAIATYTIQDPPPNGWSLGGRWRLEQERAISLAGWNTLRFNVQANAFHLVMGSSDGKPKRVAVTLVNEDIKPDAQALITPDMFGQDLRDDEELTEWIVDVTRKDLYRVLRFPNGGRHTIELRPLDPGVEFYAATFGE